MSVLPNLWIKPGVGRLGMSNSKALHILYFAKIIDEVFFKIGLMGLHVGLNGTARRGTVASTGCICDDGSKIARPCIPSPGCITNIVTAKVAEQLRIKL
jgi:hypothetical protein